jgi:hypothetical protein
MSSPSTGRSLLRAAGWASALAGKTGRSDVTCNAFFGLGFRLRTGAGADRRHQRDAPGGRGTAAARFRQLHRHANGPGRAVSLTWGRMEGVPSGSGGLATRQVRRYATGAQPAKLPRIAACLKRNIVQSSVAWTVQWAEKRGGAEKNAPKNGGMAA